MNLHKKMDTERASLLSRRDFIKTTLVAASVVTLSPLPRFENPRVFGADKKIVARLAHALVAAEPNHIALVSMADKVKERTNGNLEIQVVPGGQLGAELDAAESTSIGAIEACVVSPAGLGTFQPQFAIFSHPYLWKDWEEAKKVLYGPFVEDMQNKLIASKSLHVLGYWYFGWRHVFTRNKPINNLGDMKGLKIRVSKNKMFSETFKTLGANPTPMDWPEIYQGLQQGVVDGAEAPLPTIYATKLYEVTKHVALTHHMLQANITLVSHNWLTALPEEYQKILKEEAINAGEYMRELSQKQEQEMFIRLKEAGMTFSEPGLDEFRKATSEVYKAFEKSWGSDLFQKLQAAKQA
jgi:tripartite ATP-independent transporter DctP family solute receptor